MLRLLVSGAGDTLYHHLAERLRGVVIETDAAKAPARDSLLHCDAAVFLDLPDDTRPMERLLHAGKHVLLSAGVRWSSEILERLSSAPRQDGGQFTIANPDRYLPSRQLIRQQLDAGKLGEPGLVRIHRWDTSAAEDDREAPCLLRDLDLAMWFFKKAPNRVYALRQTVNGASLQVHLGFSGGGMALLYSTRRLPAGDGYRSLSLIGSTGAAYADDHSNMQLLYQGGQCRAVGANEGMSHWLAMIREFIEAVQAGHDLSANLAGWRRAQTVAAAVAQSLQRRQAIELEGPQ